MGNTKIANILGLARKSGNLIIGSDNLKGYRKKLYLLIVKSTAGKAVLSLAEDLSKKTGCEVLNLDIDLTQVLNINNCQIVGIKNKGFADSIMQNQK